MLVRLLNRYIFLAGLCLMLSQAVFAEDEATMSPSVVLVLKLVSATHVKPTTGIVISDTGLVVVPSEFLAAEEEVSDGEIVVLDGGTDIIKHGRPARLVNRTDTVGLAVLSVEGLGRPSFELSDDPYNEQVELHFEAFPPAKEMAIGAPPFWVPIKTVEYGPGMVSVIPGTVLPRVSGPIIDECGYLVGLSVTQDSEKRVDPRFMFADEIKIILDSMQLRLPTASCLATLQPASEDGKEQAVMSQPMVVPVQEEEPIVSATNTDEADSRSAETDPSEMVRSAGETQQEAGTHGDDLVVGNAPVPKSLWSTVPSWLYLLVGIVVVGLIWKGLLLLRLHKHTEPVSSAGNWRPGVQPASDEPATAPLGQASSLDRPRSAPDDETAIPDINALPDGFDAIVIVEGLLDTDVPFKRFCLVKQPDFSVVIGRGEAGINIEHPAISRCHTRIESMAGNMTLSDLGSNNGTTINTTPCLKGEIMFIEPEDTILLGDIPIQISVLRKEPQPS